MKIKLVLLIVLLAGGGAGGWTVLGRPKAAVVETGGTAAAARGDLRITVVEEGQFQAKDSIGIELETEVYQEQVTITKLIEAGAAVKKGDVLIELDKAPIQRQISQADMELQAAANDVVQATEELKIQRLQNAVDLESAQNDVKMAESDVNRWRDLEGPKRLKESEAKIADAERAVAEAGREVADLKEMLKEDLVSEAELRKAEFALTKAEAEREFARINLRLLKEYDNPREEARILNHLAGRKLFLDSKRSAAQSVLTQKESALLRAKTNHQGREEHLTKLKSDLEKLTMKSPCDGIVLYGHPEWFRSDDQNFRVGGKIWAHNRLLTIPDLSSFKVLAAVNEGDVNKVKEGLSVEIRPEALPTETFRGKVEKVSKVSGGNRRWWDRDGTSKFEVEISVDKTDPRLRPGMKCRVEILIEEAKGVLHVPIDSVYEKDGKNFCWVLGAGGPESRPVKVGRTSLESAEILEGLAEGDKVALYDPQRKAK